MSGAMYLNHRNAAALHRFAAEHASPRQAPISTAAAEYHDRRAEQVRSQLAAARKLGLRGSAGTVPAAYFADAPSTGN